MLREKLEQALEKKGLPKVLANFITITDESEIEGIINHLGELQKPQEFDDYLKDNAEAKSEFDRRVTKAIETYKKNNPGASSKENEQNKKGDETPEWAKAITDRLEKMEATQSHGIKVSNAKKLWQKSNIPDSIKNSDSWFQKLIDIDSETSIEDQIIKAEADTIALKQDIINSSVSSSGIPNPIGDKEATDAEIEEVFK